MGIILLASLEAALAAASPVLSGRSPPQYLYSRLTSKIKDPLFTPDPKDPTKDPTKDPNPFTEFGVDGGRTLLRGVRPALGESREPRAFFRPIVEGRRVEIRSVRPNEGSSLVVEAHLVKDVRIRQRSKDFPGQYGVKVDRLDRSIFEVDPQREGSHFLECRDGVNLVGHRST